MVICLLSFVLGFFGGGGFGRSTRKKSIWQEKGAIKSIVFNFSSFFCWGSQRVFFVNGLLILSPRMYALLMSG